MGDDGGVQVENVYPTFSNLSVSEINGNTLVTINVSDYNSFWDIDRIFINVTDGNEGVLSIAYFANNTRDSPNGQLRNVIGNNLVSELSGIKHSNESEESESCYLLLEICFTPVDGTFLNVVVWDVGGLSATYTGQYVYPPLAGKANMNIIIGAVVFSLILTVSIQILLKRRHKNENV
ncbi:MAG: hypothetical protein KKH41_07575 [Candidatus Thermoplasmatota archaeon]|nr:hypothetical protein [Euryarchaeota archaeon]MBU4031228.1 hypothetical protein [Candidatus Thermoplasmatota archaeon]MBU4071000.1 hypothetical protein [Candidatus Thermoplasmatota archaeon]MBU4143745.1 hypothetical protein [Candidatus Thermoplasmatota archaeon]MBU4592428.1 hypothetical protein [Candidatus Thermoplasmatota archaeon]